MCFPTNNINAPSQPTRAAITAKSVSTSTRRKRSVSFATTERQVFQVPLVELSFYRAPDYQRFRLEAFEEQCQDQCQLEYMQEQIAKAQQIHRQTQYTEKRRERRRQKAATAAAASADASTSSTPPSRRRMPPRRCLNNMRDHAMQQRLTKQ